MIYWYIIQCEFRRLLQCKRVTGRQSKKTITASRYQVTEKATTGTKCNSHWYTVLVIQGSAPLHLVRLRLGTDSEWLTLNDWHRVTDIEWLTSSFSSVCLLSELCSLGSSDSILFFSVCRFSQLISALFNVNYNQVHSYNMCNSYNICNANHTCATHTTCATRTTCATCNTCAICTTCATHTTCAM